MRSNSFHWPIQLKRIVGHSPLGVSWIPRSHGYYHICFSGNSDLNQSCNFPWASDTFTWRADGRFKESLFHLVGCIIIHSQKGQVSGSTTQEEVLLLHLGTDFKMWPNAFWFLKQVKLDWIQSTRTQKIFPEWVERTTTNPRLRTESSRWGEFRSTVTIFVLFIWPLFSK